MAKSMRVGKSTSGAAVAPKAAAKTKGKTVPKRAEKGAGTKKPAAKRAAPAERKSFARPDETRPFPKGAAEILKIGGGEVGRLVFQPGWRWSNDVKPLAKTKSCLAPHFQYHVSGRLAIRMDDGTEFVAEPGDVTALPMGHDAWVVGSEPAVVIDWWGASNYARPAP